MEPPCPHWAHHNHSDQHINLIFTPFLYQPIVSSPPPATNCDDDDDNNNNQPHIHHHHHRSPPPPTSQTDSGYFNLPPSSSLNRTSQPLKVVNTTPTPRPHTHTLPFLVDEEHLGSENVSNVNGIGKTRGEDGGALRSRSDEGEEGAVDDEGVRRRTAMADLVLVKPVSAEEDGDTDLREMRLRRGFEGWLGEAGGLGLGEGGGFGVEGSDEGDERVEGSDEEGRKENLWSRVKRVVGWRHGPVRLRRAKVRFSLE